MDEEESRKRNTDCVYFLASPFTCKKGLDCEYRHNEMARLNPRDCWYWFSGNCLNPTCGFRHPPLDTLRGTLSESAKLLREKSVRMNKASCRETSSESAKFAAQNSVSVNKTSIPCYFYYNFFCNKGDRCFFLHGNDSGSSFSKSATSNVFPMETKTLTEMDSGSGPTENHLNPSETSAKPAVDVLDEGNGDFKNPSLAPSGDQSFSNIDCEEVAVVKPDLLILGEGFVLSDSPVYMDQSFEEPTDDHLEPNEWRDSSPGFDVFVDTTSENLIDKADLKRRKYVLEYEFEDMAQYGPLYPDVEHLYERDRYNIHDQFDNEFILNNLRRLSARPKERTYGAIGSRTSWDSMDLRDCLRKRRQLDCSQISCLSRRHKPPILIGHQDDWPRRHGTGCKLHRRLAPRIGNNTTKSFSHSKFILSKRPRSSRKPICREKKPVRPSSMFEGPKTLAQIKEEKEKPVERVGKARNSDKTALADFQGPKSLSEILENKRKPITVMNGGNRIN